MATPRVVRCTLYRRPRRKSGRLPRGSPRPFETSMANSHSCANAPCGMASATPSLGQLLSRRRAHRAYIFHRRVMALCIRTYGCLHRLQHAAMRHAWYRSWVRGLISDNAPPAYRKIFVCFGNRPFVECGFLGCAGGRGGGFLNGVVPQHLSWRNDLYMDIKFLCGNQTSNAKACD